MIAAGDETFEAPEELNELLGSMQRDFESLSIPASRATTGSQSYDPSAQPDSSDANDCRQVYHGEREKELGSVRWGTREQLEAEFAGGDQARL